MSIHKLCIAFVAVWMTALAASAIDGRFVGTWKLNSSKSELEGSGIGSNATARLDKDGSGFKASVEAITPRGESVGYTYEVTLDGKPVKVTGAPLFDEIQTRRINDREFSTIAKRAGQVIFSERRALSRDGKTIIITRKGTDPQGRPYTAKIVFDKQ